MIKIYYELEGEYYTFKTFLYDEFFIASGTGKIVKGGNKRKSKEVSVSNTFFTSYICNSTGRPIRKPDLKLWDEYLKSFQISERTLLRWINRNKGCVYWFVIKDLVEKIKDNL